MKHELFVAHRVGADLPDTRAGLSLEAADFAHALFTRSGTLTGWNGAFAANFPENDLRQDVQISDVFQRVDDALWAQTWLKLDAGQTVTLRRRPGSSDPNYDVCVTPVFGAQGRIASVEIKHPSVSNSQLLQQLQKEILEVVATGGRCGFWRPMRFPWLSALRVTSSGFVGGFRLKLLNRASGGRHSWT